MGPAWGTLAADERGFDDPHGRAVTAFVAVVCGILGLAVGSFVNVVAHRVPQGRSVIRPSSSCPACGAPIRPGDNIPILGWLLLRGRCRDCAAPISARYPIVEGVTGLLFGATAVLIGPSWVLPAYLWFVGVTVTLVLTDLDHKRIPNRILYPGTAVAVVLLAGGAALESDLASMGRALAGGGGYFGLLFLIALVARGGFGFGDVKLAFLLGVFTAHRGWGALFVGVFAAFAIGGIVSIVLLLAGRAGRKDAIPFGPSLVLGAHVAVAAGNAVADWYLG